ncbi:MAG: flippase-like domain-containing protein [Deltaproteobacteria bacterium]|nr:flippase-like domain-containing protein [Deltaproteobacteria bacterium]
MGKRRSFTFLKFILAIGVVAYLIKTERLDLKAVSLIFASPFWLTSALFLIGINIACNTVRWHLLLRGQGSRLPLRETVRVNFIGLFFNTFLPGAVTGDLVKAFYIARADGGTTAKTRLFTSIALDRFIGVSTLAILSLVGALYGLSRLNADRLLPLVVTSAILAVGVSVFGALSLSPKLYRAGFLQKMFQRLPGGSLFLQIYEAIYAYRARWRELLFAHLLSCAGQIAFVANYLLAFQQIGGPGIPISHFFFLVPLGMLTTAVPLFPGGLGIGQAAFLQLFQLVSSSTTTAGADSFTIVQLVYFAWNMVGVVFYLQGRTRLGAVKMAASSDQLAQS